MRDRFFLLFLLTMPLWAQPTLDHLVQVPQPRTERNLEQIQGYLRDNPKAVGSLVKRPKTRGKVPLLVFALESADVALTRLLLQAGADLNTVYGRGKRPALQAAVLADGSDQTRQRLLDLLLTGNIDPSATDTLQRGAFHALVESRGWGKTETLRSAAETLFKAGVPLETEDVRGFTPLLAAVMRHDARMVKILLDLGADPKRKSEGLELDAHTLAQQQSHTLDHPVEAKEVLDVLAQPVSH